MTTDFKPYPAYKDSGAPPPIFEERQGVVIRPRSRLQRYRTTAAGLAVLKAHGRTT